MRASEFLKESKNADKDKNGLAFSNVSGSGYKYAGVVDTPALKGKFIAYAKVSGDEMQEMNIESGSNQRIPGFFGHKDTVGLAVFDDIRDAAYVGQKFNENRDNNLLELFSGNESIVPKSPGKWEHEPDWDRVAMAADKMAGASEKRKATLAANKPTLDSQTAMAKFYKERGSEYSVSGNDGKAIRGEIENIMKGNKRPKDEDFMAAAEQAFEPYRN